MIGWSLVKCLNSGLIHLIANIIHRAPYYEYITPRVQVPNNHILSKILTYITTILKPSTQLLGPLDPWGYIPSQNPILLFKAPVLLGGN